MKTKTITVADEKSYNCLKGAVKMPRYESRVGRIESDMTTFWLLSRMSWIATKLYNTALWNAKETWNDTGKIPSGFDLQKVVLASYYHSFVPAHTYQHCAHQVGNAFKSWYALRKKDTTARPPGFRKKQELSTFMVDAFKVIDTNTILITPTPALKQEMSYPHKKLSLRLHWNTAFPEKGQIKQIEIVPRKDHFELHAKILLPEPEWKQDGQVMAIDLGMRNPIVSMDEQGNVDMYKGGAILSNLHYWNKEKARVQSEVMGRTKGKKKSSHALRKMAKHGSQQVKHSIHSMTNKVVELCVQRNVREVVVGDLTGIKKNKNGTGKKWNKKASQNWQQFPIQQVVAQLDYKLARHCILLSEQDERGTSKGRCSLCGCTDRSKLHRVHRGMFLCENCNTTQNADVNGVGNQLVRYLRVDALPFISSSGCLAQPSVYRWDGHLWREVDEG
jgi:putative transposase